MRNEIGKVEASAIDSGVQDELSGSLGQALRTFTFYRADDEKFELILKHIGDISQIYAGLNNGKTETDRIDVPEKINTIIKIFNDHSRSFINNRGGETKKRPRLLISGGFIRDVISGDIPHDIDLATDMPSQEVYDLIKDVEGIKRVGIHGEACEVVRVKFDNGEEYEISSFRAAGENGGAINSPGQDAQAREFTINALFYDPVSGNVIDYVGGIKDLDERKLRFTGSAEERIKEDGIRMLRYVRFLLKTDFSPFEDDMETVRKMAPSIKNVAFERIKTELDKILSASKADKALNLLDSLGLLEQIFPEIKALQACEQGPPYHLEGDVYKHTLLVADKLPQSAGLRLKWAAIFHDIAKPETREEVERDGKRKVSFLKHDQLGSEKVEPILKRVNFSNKEIEDIKWLIANHQLLFQKVSRRIKNSDKMHLDRARIRARAVFKEMIMNKDMELVEDLVNLAIADSDGKISEEADNKQDQKIIKEIFSEAKEELKRIEENGIDFKKLVNGKIIMETLNLKPGPEIGRIQKQVLTALLQSGENFNDEDSAKERIKELILELNK